MSPTAPEGEWIRRLRPSIVPALHLVCFPHAGGSATFFHSWATSLPPGVDLWAAQYPGHGDRITERFASELTELAERAALAIARTASLPLVLFGHSMGALVAYEVARRLEARGGLAVPSALVVSGHDSPGRSGGGVMHMADDDTLWKDVERLGGTSDAALSDPELRALALPAVRADYRLSETYRHTPGPVLQCPVTALMGAIDTEVTVAGVEDWRSVAQRFEMEVLPGGHFYLVEQRADVVRTVLRRLPASVGRSDLWLSAP